ncbi:MAG: SUMF1/EgtB/PvdO family nonheme iron enzyme [Pirellulales bacterium]
MRSLAAVAALIICGCPSVFADTFGTGENTFEIEFVTIGDPGNEPDTTGTPNNVGAVDYVYRIGKYEVSEGMVDAVNALGGLNLDLTPWGPNKPALEIHWLDAAKFVNWLNTTKGYLPAYKFVADEFQLWQPFEAGYDPDNLFRNTLARYFLPSDDEWYKAAYYDPIAEVYYDYPTGSDSVPDGIDFAGDTTFDAVFYDGARNPQPNDFTDVGVLSPYGTAGQGGSATEWLETASDNPEASRAWRGGEWNDQVYKLESTFRAIGPADYGGADQGFRVVFRLPDANADANGDGHVDGTDYLIWAAAYGDDPALDPPGSPLNGDFNFDERVDGLDYLVWAANYLQGPNDGVVVPEPRSVTLFIAGVLAALRVRRKGI